MNRFTSCLTITLVILSQCLFAQNKFHRGAVGLTFGTNQYSGEICNDFYRFGNFNSMLGLNYSHYLTNRTDFSFHALMGKWGYKSEKNNSFSTDMLHINALLRVKLLDLESPRLMPYVFGGVGLNNYSNWLLKNKNGTTLLTDNEGNALNLDELEGLHGTIPVGLGLQIRLSDNIFLNLDETFIFQGSDGWDGIIRDGSDNMLIHSVGISFGLFHWKDSDKDGISDKLDKCADTPVIAKVDLSGCPLDTDADGIADFEDICPAVAGVKSGKGCPDADGDTFTDDVDKCPQVAGLAAFNGCPDSDGDGITDADDSCPKEKGIAQFKGCPDTDNDGVQDKEDSCPNVKGVAALKGCPDKDNDGIKDSDDKCPDAAGTKANNGCPEVKEEVKQLFAQALTGVKFETGKDIIKTESFAILDNVVKVMMENASYKLNIAGHTDNVGDAAKNLDLSDRRAKAVQKYLVDKGVPAARLLSAVGYGDKNPLGDNTTKEGRAQNRRVEFKVEF